MSELTKKAALAALAGWTLGSPRNGRSEYVRMTGYNPIPARMDPSHALDAWLVWAKHLEAGRPPELLHLTVDDHLRLSVEESKFGATNLRLGFGSPFSGSFANPRPRGSEAVLRSVFWGLAWHGNADKAARYAYFDASLDHAGEGVYVPVALAAAVATATPSTSVSEVVDAFLKVLPESSWLHRAVPSLRGSVGNPEGPREFARRAQTLLETNDLQDAALTGAFTLLGLLHGNGDPGKSMLVTAGCGGSASQSTASVAVITTLLNGDLAPEWLDPLGTDYLSTFALRQVDPPATVQAWADLIGRLAPKPSLVAPEQPAALPEPEEILALPTPDEVEEEAESLPAPAEHSGVIETTIVPVDGTTVDHETEEQATEGEPQKVTPAVITVEAPVPVSPEWPIALPVQPETLKLIASSPLTTHVPNGDVLVTTRFLDSALAVPGSSVDLQIALKNLTEETKSCELDLRAPEGWELAHRVKAARLDPGTGPAFPVVARAVSRDAVQNPRLYLTVDGVDTVLPFARPIRWMVAGPFPNDEGMGYDYLYRPEKEFDPDETMSGRSGLGIKWQEAWFPGHLYDLEPFFGHGPGVVYLYAELAFQNPGPMTLKAAVGSGIKVWVDGERVLAYHDSHLPAPWAGTRYDANFSAGKTVKILVKVLRANKPVDPLLLVFSDENGNLAVPLPNST